MHFHVLLREQHLERVASAHVPVEGGNLSPSFIHLFILQPDGAMCNTEVPATTPLLYSFTGVISVCLMMWVKLYLKKKRN